MDVSVPLTEKGVVVSTGHLYWSQLDENEPTPELRWPHSIDVYDRMRRQEAQVSSVLRAATLPIRRTRWSIDGTGCNPLVTQTVASDLGLPIRDAAPAGEPHPRRRGRFSWHQHLRLALLMLPFGYSFFEQVYRYDEASELYHLRKLLWLPPRTISKVDVATDGGLIAIEQQALAGGTAPRLEVDRLVAYVNEHEGGNWLGQSILRTAYKYWLLKDQMLRVGAQTVQRNGMGIPIFTAAKPSDLITDPDTYRAAEQSQIDAGLEIARSLRSGENAGASLANGSTLRLAGVEGKTIDALPWVRYYDEQMAKAVLANFLTLGGDQATGSYGMAETFERVFSESLQAVATEVCAIANEHVVEDLVDANWGQDEPAPQLVFEEIGAPAVAEAIKLLVDSGVITADAALEAHVRRTHGLPAADPNTARTSRQESNA